MIIIAKAVPAKRILLPVLQPAQQVRNVPVALALPVPAATNPPITATYALTIIFTNTTTTTRKTPPLSLAPAPVMAPEDAQVAVSIHH